MGRTITDFAIARPKLILFLAILVTALALVRSPTLKVDTDPENMLGSDEEVRVLHNLVKKDFELSDMLVVGVVNDHHPDGVFNPETLDRVDKLTRHALTIEGVVKRDVMAPSTVDDVLQDGPGTVRFKYLMESVPADRSESLHLRDRIKSNPLFSGTLVSEDGGALAIYVPIKTKDIAHRVSLELSGFIESLGVSDDDYHITGLPVAEDTFGVEMFQQMAVSAPLAGLVVFLLMLFFFRKLVMVVSPMLVAMLTVGITMGTLISLGFTVHIMSSMIPIFLMPIAVVDSVHILSVFFDRYQQFRDRSKTLQAVMDELFTPMLYTSVTTFAGFASLALTPIPPVQVFGLFVGLGVLMAWLLTVTLVPAYIMLFIPEESLARFGVAGRDEEQESLSLMGRLLVRAGRSTATRAKLWVGLTVGVLAISFVGISKININDNPVKWFVPDHPIRIADRVLNDHFGGTYEAFLVLEPGGGETSESTQKRVDDFLGRGVEEPRSTDTVALVAGIGREYADVSGLFESGGALRVYDELVERLERAADGADDQELADDLYDLADGAEELKLSLHVFKDPALLRYVEKLQTFLANDAKVGKSNSLADLVKKVHMELFEGDPAQARIPDSAAGVAQTILSFQGSHDPDDVFHFVTPDYRKLNLWVQLKSGDNRDMEQVVESVGDFFATNPPPTELKHSWAGLTYLNVVWQEKMVEGMLNSLLGSFVIVLILMAILFRSALWGLLSMVPLSVTIAFIYGMIGLAGKDYDMPVAVLSSLTLGMSIDFAIHYIERARELVAETGSWAEASKLISHAPARAIARNAIVIAVGFTPLLLANLIPYRTVGLFLAMIMAVSGVATLIILPSLMTIFQSRLFARELASHKGANQ